MGERGRKMVKKVLISSAYKIYLVIRLRTPPHRHPHLSLIFLTSGVFSRWCRDSLSLPSRLLFPVVNVDIASRRCSPLTLRPGRESPHRP